MRYNKVIMVLCKYFMRELIKFIFYISSLIYFRELTN